jgi:rSAM/selenodomain-associated transferase 2
MPHAATAIPESTLPRPISIIIPALNEAEQIGSTLRHLDGAEVTEIIVVDGGSSDATAKIAESFGAHVLMGPPNRGQQQNLGAASAVGELLLFLHADTRLPEGFTEQVRSILAKPGTVAGAFRFSLDASGWGITLVECMVRIRCKLFALPYGDQALFMPREAFEQVGRFANLPAMEDFDLVRRLKRRGTVQIAESASVTSARRWREHGVWRVTWRHQLCILGYFLRISPAKLARLRNFERPPDSSA